MASAETSLDAGMISKMKVAELKKELKGRGLSTVGTKLELAERLQSAGAQAAQDSSMSDDGNAGSEILDEDEVLDDDVEEAGEFDDDELAAEAALADDPKPKPTAAVKRPAPQIPEATQQVLPKKRVLIRPSHSVDKENGAQTKDEEMEEERILNNGASCESGGGGTEKKVIKLSAISVKERLELRAQKFGASLSDDAKKQARAERFGVTSSAPANKISGKISLSGINTSEEVLKKRAERFGCNVSTKAIKIEADEKRKKRTERFGGNAPTATTLDPTATTLDDKKKLRAERFKI